MRILIAEDEAVSRRLLQQTLERWGYEVVVAADGIEAWACLSGVEAPQLAILDWMMPGVDGVELCQRVRAVETQVPIYIMLLTARAARAAAAGVDPDRL
jgi:CheY-like chemotaxis protein